MAYLLLQGRQLVNTKFQEDEIARVTSKPLDKSDFLDGKTPIAGKSIDTIVFGITSFDQRNSRYNPIPGPKREVGVDRFARLLKEKYGVGVRIVEIPHYAPSDKYIDISLKEIAETTGDLKLTPKNTVVLSSTPRMIEMYRKRGFGVLPGEFKTKHLTPIELIEKVVEAGEGWSMSDLIKNNLSEATYTLWQDNPEIIRKLLWLYRDPLLTEQGDLTETRDYVTYGYGMSNNELIKVKYTDVKDVIRPGKIVDEGCADGALLAEVAKYFPDSDLIGIEITGAFVNIFNERKSHNGFSGNFAYCHQRNIMEAIFEPESIDTILCNSTLHELWSYGEGGKTVRQYLANKFAQLVKGGRFIARDVVGPENKDQEIYMSLNTEDGSDEDIYREFSSKGELTQHLSGLSTYARFKRFARDYLARKMGSPNNFEYEESSSPDGKIVKLRLKDAIEFMTKKDYTDNWQSELNEEFAFWDFNQYKKALIEAGFRVIENPNEPSLGSRVYRNQWIVDNRWKNKVELYCVGKNDLEKMEYPVTTMVLVAEKP